LFFPLPLILPLFLLYFKRILRTWIPDCGRVFGVWCLQRAPPKHLFVLSQIALLQSVSLLLNTSLTVSSLISSPSLSTPSPVPFNFPICRNLALPYFSL
jgi:hypothetical protein